MIKFFSIFFVLFFVGCVTNSTNIKASKTGNNPPPNIIGIQSSYTILGPRQRPTGGLMLTGYALHEVNFGKSNAGIGGALTIFGFDVPRWMAILGGPTVTIRTQINSSIYIGTSIYLDSGRIPACTKWGFCMLYAGFFPSFSTLIRYVPSSRANIDLTCGLRVIHTLAYKGLGGNIGLAGVYYW